MNNDARRETFVDAALELFNEKGLESTSIKDISQKAGVTRSLFYHYFPDKNAVVEAVLDKWVGDFIERLQTWADDLGTDVLRNSLYTLVPILRNHLSESKSFSDRVIRSENVALRTQFTLHAAKQVSLFLAERCSQWNRWSRRDEVRHPEETFYLLTLGTLSLLSQDDSIPDDTVVDLIVDTIRLDEDR